MVAEHDDKALLLERYYRRDQRRFHTPASNELRFVS